MLKIYEADKNYISYLHNIEPKVFSNALNNNRKYIGIVLKINDINYFAPLSSKQKINKKKIHIFNLFGSKNNPLGSIYLNNMIPIPIELTKETDIKIYSHDNIEIKKYKSLLIEQINFLNKNYMSIIKNANKLYNIYQSQFNKNTVIGENKKFIISLCCDFQKLEDAMKNYHT